ncbi:MAG: D-alanyl-D-alanine carboxypeptidase family protein [Eubacteriales bacterium]
MKKIMRISLVITLLLTLFYYVPNAAADNIIDNKVSVSAAAAILVDAKTGQVLFAKNPFQQRPPASTTKVITALLAIESGRLMEPVTVSRRAAYTEGSSMYLSAGEVLTMSDLLYGALLNSGNDACAAIAEHVAGSLENFAVLMNMKALALGAVNTNFTNPHGLPDKDHYTCAYDLALIARSALENQTFSEIVKTKDKVVNLPGQGWDRRLQNTNQLLWRYFWADGIKTGTTNAAGQCLISSATKGSRQLVAVVLRSGDRWNDSIKMFEYGFNHYEYYQAAVTGAEFGQYKVQNGVREVLPVVYGGNLGILVPVRDPGALEKRVRLNPYPVAPVKKGQIIGEVSYYLHKNFVGKVNLTAAVDIREIGFWDILTDWWKQKLSGLFGYISSNYLHQARGILVNVSNLNE